MLRRSGVSVAQVTQEWRLFFSTLKTERASRNHYTTREAARADIFDYIERFWNPKRRHSTLGVLTAEPANAEYLRGATKSATTSAHLRNWWDLSRDRRQPYTEPPRGRAKAPGGLRPRKRPHQ